MKTDKIRYNQLKWHSVANPSYGGCPEAPAGTEGGGKRGALPPEVLRRIAMDSSDGGRGYCKCCHHYFAMYYLKMVKFSAFDKDLCCADCRKDKHLQVVN